MTENSGIKKNFYKLTVKFWIATKCLSYRYFILSSSKKETYVKDLKEIFSMLLYYLTQFFTLNLT